MAPKAGPMRSPKRIGRTLTIRACSPTRIEDDRRAGRLGFHRAGGGKLELAVVNPVGVFGPVLGPDYSTSIILVKRLMDGDVPGCPRIYFGGVDVRDVADLHIRAMTDPVAKGQRFLAV